MIFWHPRLDLLSRRLDGMLEPKVSLRLEQHLKECSLCRGWLEAFAQVKKGLQDLPTLEGNHAGPMPVPVLVPVETVPFFQKGVALALLVGIGFILGLLLFRPAQPTMRIISSSSQLVTSEGILQPFLQSDTAMRAFQAQPSGHVDLEIPDHLLLRLRAGTMITWQQVNHPWWGQRPNIVVNLMQGELLARTKEHFWGSHLEIRTPTATTLVKGTALAVKVDPSLDSTTLKVLAGSVFFSPYLGKVGVEVGSGQMSQIQSARLPERPRLLLPSERQQLLEVYRIGQDPEMALVVGEGPERVEELLRPALLYLTRRKNTGLQPFLRKAVGQVNAAILAGEDLSQNQGDLKVLEMTARSMEDQEKGVPLRLFLGGCAARLGEVERARAHFDWVVKKFPGDSRAPLALAAIGTSEAYRQILARYPNSPEADLARDFLKKHPR